MSRTTPDGFEQILSLGDAVKAARSAVAEKERSISSRQAELDRGRAELAELQQKLAKLERRFRELVLSGACADENCDHHDHSPAPSPERVEPAPAPTTVQKALKALKAKRAAERRRKQSTELEPGLFFVDLPKKLQLAWIIFREGELDYADAALRIYQSADAKAKARVNALMTELRAANLVTPSQGQRRYKLTIDGDELMARSRASARR